MIYHGLNDCEVSFIDNKLEEKESAMAVKLGYAFILVGVLLLSLSIYVYSITTTEAEFGTILINIILSVFDRMVFVIIGFYLIYVGYRLVRGSKNGSELINIGGQLSIFTFFSLFFTLLFNSLAQPEINSSWRIFTFFLQAISRLLNPSFSAGFFIPILGLVSFIIVSVWFHKSLIGKNSHKSG